MFAICNQDSMMQGLQIDPIGASLRPLPHGMHGLQPASGVPSSGHGEAEVLHVLQYRHRFVFLDTASGIPSAARSTSISLDSATDAIANTANRTILTIATDKMSETDPKGLQKK